MNKFVKKIVALAACTVTALSMSVVAFAADDRVVEIVRSKDVTLITNYYDNDRNIPVSKERNELKDKTGKDRLANGITMDKSYGAFKVKSDGTKVTITCSSETFDAKKEDEQKTAVNEMLQTVAAWGVSDETRKDLQGDFTDWDIGITEAQMVTMVFSNTKADLATAMQWFAPFQGPLSTIIGVGVIIVVVMLIASTVFDLLYIGMPMMRNFLNGKAEENGKAKPMGVSFDAVKVVEMVEGGGGGGQGGQGGGQGTGGNAYWAYLKRRIFTYIILAVCILYLISGQLSGLIGGLLDLVSGITG